MPKSKVRKKTAYTPPPRKATTAQAKGPSSTLYKSVMLGLMLLGLAWIVVNYLAGNKLSFLIALGGDGAGFNYNFVIGFGLIVAGLLMTMKWR